MLITDDQRAAGVDEDAVMPTIPSGIEAGTELNDLEFPHLHQMFDELNVGYHHPTPEGSVALYINVLPATAEAFFETPPGLGLKVVETEIENRPFVVVIFIIDFDDGGQEFDFLFSMRDPTSRYDLAQLISTDDARVHLLIGGRGQLYYGFQIGLPIEDDAREALAGLLAKHGGP